MTIATADHPLTLGIYPTARGFGWIAFANPPTPYHWGIVAAHGDKNATCLRRVREIVERHRPETLVLEALGRSGPTDRIGRLHQALVAYAKDQSLEVAVYPRADIIACFATVGATTRREIAEAIISHIPILREHLPERRRAWDSEDRRMALFAAAAVVLTHFRRNALFFPELHEAA